MFTRREVLALTAAAGFGAFAGPAAAGEAGGTGLPPKVGLEEAVRLARDYVKKNGLDTAGKYLASAALHARKGGHTWDVVWTAVSGRTEDGYLIVHVDPTDGSAGSVSGK